ncbi:MAG: 5'-methylthioadenosine nucleosidase, partial [Pseudomonadota bacterium]
MSYKRIAIVMAMQAEAQPLIERLELAERPEPSLPIRMFENATGDCALITNGRDAVTGADNVGTQPATLAAWLAVERCKPHLLLNAGTAGGFAARGAAIGDVYLSAEAIRFHDRRIPLPGYEAYGIGNYPVIDAGDLAWELGLKTGIVS